MLVKKKNIEIGGVGILSGTSIESLAYEEYGNPNGLVILITHYLTGNPHAAGIYDPLSPDEQPGYWDSIIGPGKAVDTNEYRVISIDTLINYGVMDSGPATHGMGFPKLTINDFVKTQRAVLEKLEINKLHAVIGASLGGLQAYEWAAAHSDMVERIIPVFAPGWITQAVKTLKDEWKAPILNDPEWNGGNYNPRFTPLNGLVETMKLVTENARHPDFFQLVLPQISTLTKAEWLKSNAKTRASTGDANNFLYLASAVQAFKLGHDDGLKAIKQPV